MSTPHTQILSFLARHDRQRSVARGARCFTRVIAAAFVLLALPASGRADWSALGDTVNPGPSFYLGYRPDVADAGGTPYIAWREGTPQNVRDDILVSRWTGTDWQLVGQPLNSTANVSTPSITSVEGVPYVAFIEFPADNDDPAQVRVAKLNASGDGWVDAGGGSLNHDPVNGDAQEVVIGVVGSVPYVAFTEAAGTQSNLWVKKLEGGSWVAVGGQVNISPISAFAPDVAGVAGVPHVSWMSDGDGVGMNSQSGLRVSRFSGSSWAGVGGKLRDGLSGGGQLADVDGAPAILFGRPNAFDEAEPVYAEWNGTTWVEWGEQLVNAFAGKFGGEGSLATIGGVPHVAIVTIGPDPTPDQVRVLSFDGAAWTQVGSGLRRSLAANPYEPVIAAVGDDAVVAWREQADSVEKIHASQIEVSFRPETTITGTSTATNAGAATYGFTAVPSAGATFECSWDNAPFAPCTSPHTSGVLSPGAHNFRVRATNANGTDPTPASRDFIVDRVAPTTTIRLDGNRVPSGAFAGSVTVNADVTDPPLSSGIRNKFCLIDPLTPPTSFGNFGSQPCGVVVTAVGTHTAYAIANDQAGNESAIVRATFSIAEAPDTIIVEGPSGLVSSMPVQWAYRTTIPGSTFECQLDSEPFRPCDATRRYLDLSDGPHTFSVRAVGPTGVADPTPAIRSITVGPKQISGSCSGTFPFGDPFSLSGKFSTGGVNCVALEQPCPEGSTCTITLTRSVTDADIQTPWSTFGQILSNTGGFKYVGPRNNWCYSTPEEDHLLSSRTDPDYPLQPACPQESSLSVLGPGFVTAKCEVGRSVYGSGFHIRGPDDQRRHSCAATLVIQPRHILGVTVTGTGGATTVPGPGQLTITGALVGAQSAVASRATIQAATDPAPAFKFKKRVKAEGVVRFRIGLKGEAKRLYKAGGVVELEITSTFTAADGTTITTQEVITQQRPEKPRRVLKAKGPKSCTIFAGECP